MHEQVYLKDVKGKHSLMTLHDDVKSILIHLFLGYIL